MTAETTAEKLATRSAPPKIQFLKKGKDKTHTVVVPVCESLETGPALEKLDKRCYGIIKRALANTTTFKGKIGQTLSIALPDHSDFTQLVILGLGKPEELNVLKAEEAGGKLFSTIGKSCKSAALLTEPVDGAAALSDEEVWAHLAAGLALRSYSFDKYKSKTSKDNDEIETKLESFDIISETHSAIKKAYGPLDAVIAGTFLARDLVNEPPNYLLPEPYAKLIRDELKPLGVNVEILDKKKMEKLGMGAALGVAQGSDNPPCMVIMTWDGRKTKKKDDKPLAYVGKGVTFDTGGISLKPGKGMSDMKMDMGGSAAVVGAMKSLALRKADSYVVGIVGLVENMPSGKAYRPADVLTSLSGKTIEVLNTDAEGRLVLADALTYVQDTYDPRLVIDLATLTGAILVALAHEYAGTFVNNDALWAHMDEASAATGEKLWRMPLDKTWTEAIKSPTADIQNLSSLGPYGGSCTAAAFLEYFIDEERNWAHIDIAGAAWNPKDKPTAPKYGTGFGVRVLDRLADTAT